MEAHIVRPEPLPSHSFTASNLSVNLLRNSTMAGQRQNDLDVYKPSKAFKYETNPYDRELLAQKREQVE